MAQTITYLNRRRDPAGDVQARASHQLSVEKMGVISGFLLGLPVGFGVVSPTMGALGSPGWLSFIAGAIVTAVFTRTGQVMAMTFTKAERFDSRSEDI